MKMQNQGMDRREFFQRSAITAAAVAAVGSGARAVAQETKPPKPFPKAVITNMLPKELSDADKFKLAKDCGFDAVEAPPVDDLGLAAKQGEQARAAGIRIHSVIYGGWGPSLSDPDPAVQEKARANVEKALHCAKAMGADDILLVPAVVKANVRYVEAWERSQKHIKLLIPVAEELKIIIAVEEVWNDFLMSPMEFARYVDEFNSPWVRSYFDVGNVVAFGYPQDWIRTLGNRIVRVHLKDFKRKEREWVNLGEGSIEWPEVRKAFDEVGYSGYVTAELDGGDKAYFTDLAQRIGKLLGTA
jgi:hexulose-6-phosphate isomerase